MKAPFLAAVALVAVTFAGVAQAGPGSRLYLTVSNTQAIFVIQGNAITSFPEVYSSDFESPIAVYGDIRTTGFFPYPNLLGGQYTLSGTPTGTTYLLPGGVDLAVDSTTDGIYNYLVDYYTGTVFQTARDFTNPKALFSVGPDYSGITYDATNNSLWVSGWYGNQTVADYSLNGTVLSSFSTGHFFNGALALDPADHTLWLANDYWNNPYDSGRLEQYSTAGVLLSIGPEVGVAYGAEFDLQPTATPEPGTLIMFGSGILGLAGVLRRKINL